ncbi:MAG: tape measure protein [Vallitaleaceae bacterium]|nr:tape measure protein [Vallitaleaceae bacterium]
MSVDQRIVDMRFNNQQFEKGIQGSLKSLDSLKKGLDLKDASKGLDNLARAGKQFSLDGIGSGIEHISSKFTALGIIGVTTLQNLTNSVVNAGKNFAKALTIDPIKTGLSEYETKMNAITTILTNTESKGTTLTDVNKALAELNEYADLTIYNFAEMTRNIGTFTAAGIDLDTATKSIKGIANLAAGSGSNAQQASTAMYQLSQALAAGSIKLQDWNSVVNAGMGGELFQNALKATAKDMGIFVDETKPFRETLQQGWITSDVLTKTLEGFSENETLVKAATQVKTFTQLLDVMKESVQSGWAVSWENIIGDREEAIAVLTGISDGFNALIGPSAEARNNMLQFWNANGGRDATIEALSGAFKTLMSVITPISDAFKEIFPPTTGKQLVAMSKGLNEFVQKIKIGDSTITNIKLTFKGLFSILGIGVELFKAIGGAVGSLVGDILPASEGLLSFTGTLGAFMTGVYRTIQATDFFNNAIKNIGNFLKPVVDGIREGISGIFDSIDKFNGINTGGLDEFGNKVEVVFKPFAVIGGIVAGTIGFIGTVIKNVLPFFGGFATAIGSVANVIGEFMSNGLQKDKIQSSFDIFNAGIFTAILLGIRKFVKALTSIVDEGGGFLEGITGIIEGVGGSLEAFQLQLKAGALLKIAFAIGVLAASLLVLSLIDAAKLATALAAISVLFAELFVSMGVLTKMTDGKRLGSMTKMVVAMIGMSAAILILSFALATISKLDWDGVAKGLIAVAVMAKILVVSTESLSKNKGRIAKSAAGLILFAVAINVLTSAVSKLGELDIDKLGKGLLGVGVLVGTLSVFLSKTNFKGMGVSKGAGLILLAVSIRVLAESVKMFSEIDSDKLTKGLFAVGVVLTELALFLKFTGGSKNVISTAIGLTILGGAMLIFSKAVGDMGAMKWDVIGRGLATMAGVLGLVTLALNFMPKNMVATSLGLLVVSVALTSLADSLVTMGSMKWENIAKGLVVLGGSLLIIAGAMYLMTTALPGAAALLVVSTALSIFIPVLQTLGKMSWGEIGRGLLALAASFAVLGIAALVLTPVIPSLVALGGSLILLGAGLFVGGAGLLMFSTALAALAISGTAGAAALVVIVSSIISLIPLVLQKIGEGIVALATAIGEGAPALADAITKTLMALFDTIIVLTPKFVETIFVFLGAMSDAMLNYIPTMVDNGMQLILGILKGIAANIKDVTATGIEVMLNFLDGIASKLPDVIDSGFNMVISFINGLSTAIDENTDEVIEAVQNLMNSFLDAGKKVLTAGIEDFTDIGKNIADGLVNGMKNTVEDVKTAAKNLGSETLSAMAKVLQINSPSKISTWFGEMVALGTGNGIKKGTPDAITKGELLAERVKTSISDTVNTKTGEKAGINITQGIAKGISQNRSAVVAEVDKIEESAFDKSVKWIDDRKYYDQLSLSQELAAWQRVQSRYLAGTDERKKADREVYRLQKELTSKKKALDTEYYNSQKELNRKMTDDIKSLNDEYENALKSRADAIYDSYRLFDSIEEPEAVDGSTLVKNLSAQVNSLKEWQNQLSIISKKGVTKGLIDELTEMGPSALPQIKALNTLSAEELDIYVEMWKEKHKIAKVKAIGELEGMRVDTDKKIKEIRETTKTELGELTNTWKSELDILRGVNQQQLNRIDHAWLNTMNNIKGIASGISNAISGIGSSVAKASNSMSSGLTKITRWDDGTVKSVTSNTSEGLRKALDNIMKETGFSTPNPVIKPVIDLTDVYNSKEEIDKIMKDYNLTPTSSISKASKVSTTSKSTNTSTNQNGSITPTKEISFIQNNYSPKPLSRLDIYRQTNNQLTALKGAVTSA